MCIRGETPAVHSRARVFFSAFGRVVSSIRRNDSGSSSAVALGRAGKKREPRAFLHAFFEVNNMPHVPQKTAIFGNKDQRNRPHGDDCFTWQCELHSARDSLSGELITIICCTWCTPRRHRGTLGQVLGMCGRSRTKEERGDGPLGNPGSHAARTHSASPCTPKFVHSTVEKRSDIFLENGGHGLSNSNTRSSFGTKQPYIWMQNTCILRLCSESKRALAPSPLPLPVFQDHG